MKPQQEIEKIREMARTLWRHREYECELDAEEALVELLTSSRRSLLDEIESKIPPAKFVSLNMDTGENRRDWCRGYNAFRSEILKVLQSLHQDNKETKACPKS